MVTKTHLVRIEESVEESGIQIRSDDPITPSANQIWVNTTANVLKYGETSITVLGATGIQGATGIGIDGVTGIQGVAGTDGLQGVTGLAGIGIDGVTGIQGVTGLAGTDGLQGVTGLAGIGIDGVTGIQGVTGLAGIGINGATGIQGAIGSTGIQGVTGLAGIGYTGAQGATGLASVAGSVKYVQNGVGTYLTLSTALAAASPGDTIMCCGNFTETAIVTASINDINITFLPNVKMTLTGGSKGIVIAGNRIKLVNPYLYLNVLGTVTAAIEVSGADCSVETAYIETANANLILSAGINLTATSRRNWVSASINKVLGTTVANITEVPYLDNDFTVRG